jgi:hypothetical protein
LVLQPLTGDAPHVKNILARIFISEHADIAGAD